jgi:hypothetical protein
MQWLVNACLCVGVICFKHDYWWQLLTNFSTSESVCTCMGLKGTKSHTLHIKSCGVISFSFKKGSDET